MGKTNINYRNKKYVFINTFLIFMLFPLFTWSAEFVQRKSGESIQTFAQSVLPRDAELVHPTVEVTIQGSSRAVVAIYRDKKQSTNFSGLVLLPEEKSQKYQVTHLAAIKEADGLFDIEVKSVFTAKTKHHDNNGLVVLYSYYRLGSGEENGDAAYFYYLDDGSWKIDEELSDRLVGVKNAKQAKTRLK
ncbi:hypothetical protein sS8_1987 [Methylocaldum marinum]|uniref:Uncharacterized protein n=1 Tax=Methylocaldum marinum TaxID=1432792 RepID=A0A250KSK6_9GAMM|nr:hypothetical protein [Methylocaldum marinum]BBA33941.1 hypothetical protein sS8_1987 [Methylocaldum marinum]